MVTKPKPDPLVEELPPEVEPAPKRPSDIKFDVVVTPYIVGGQIRWSWEIVDHTHKDHIGRYVSHGASGLLTKLEAEGSAVNYVARIRETLVLKLSLPEPYRITL